MKVFPPPRVVAVYNPVLRAVHWLMAILIFAALALGVWAIQLPRSDFRSEVLFVHKSIGVTVFALVILRVVVRLIVGAPAYARPAGKTRACRRKLGASRALRPNDRNAGQRLREVGSRWKQRFLFRTLCGPQYSSKGESHRSGGRPSPLRVRVAPWRHPRPSSGGGRVARAGQARRSADADVAALPTRAGSALSRGACARKAASRVLYWVEGRGSSLWRKV